MTIWKIGDVLEYVEHPTRNIRCGETTHPELAPFILVNRLGELLNKFPADEQEMYISNFFDTLEQVE